VPTPPGGGSTPPGSALTAFSLTPSRFKAASRGATFSRTATGAKVSYTLTAAGPVALQILRAKRGVRVGRRCLALKTGRTGTRCTRYVEVGKPATIQSAAGVTTRRFSGRVKGKKLKPGRYRITATAASGSPRTVSFRIVRR
jgi:hypothetical protein